MIDLPFSFSHFLLFLLLPGAYLVPYFILLLIIGIPLFFLELAVGQKVRRGSIGVWNYVCPSLGGIGVSSLMVRNKETTIVDCRFTTCAGDLKLIEGGMKLHEHLEPSVFSLWGVY